MKPIWKTTPRLFPALMAVLLFLLPSAAPGGAQEGPAHAPSGQEPSLVVVLVVDQLRGDLLERYSPAFSGGFRRLLDEGRVYTRALHDHAATETSPGHAAISTGVTPARAGIPSNSWRVDVDGEFVPVFNVIDPGEALLGAPGLPGASPQVLLRGGLADWISEAEPEARVVSISAKARAAVLMAGKTRGEVAWFDPQVGRFVTSTFYGDRNPDWLDRFNEEGLPAFRADTLWTSTVPAGMEYLSAPDTAAFEGDGIRTFFPHRYSHERVDTLTDDFFLWFEGTPMLDRATLELARAATEARGLGRADGRLDFLSVSLSQTDRVGHAYGPLSREQLDNLIRLDRNLGTFLDHLDRWVGEENYLLALTGDHGVLTMPERAEGEGGRLTMEDRAKVEAGLGEAYREARADGSSLESVLARTMKELPFVGPVFTQSTLRGEVSGDSLAVLFQNSFREGRPSGLLSIYGVEMWWEENLLDWSYPVGTTHGSPYDYDRWVSMILAGPGVVGERVDAPVRPMDLAPTLAMLAGVKFPDDLDGRPLTVR